MQGGRLINMNGSFMGQTLKWEESLVKSDDIGVGSKFEV